MDAQKAGRIVSAGNISAEVLASPPTVRSRSWNRLDLSHARLLHLRFLDARISQCRFHRTDLSDLRLWNATIADSVFDTSDLSNSALGTWQNNQPNTWLRCNLVHCDLRGSFFRGARLTKCVFSRNKLDGVTFGHSRLRIVAFIGPLRGVEFDERTLPDRPPGSPLIDVDFTQATFHEVTFHGCHFIRASWPDDPDLHLVANYPLRAQEALTALSGEDTEAARDLTAILENSVRGFRDSNSTELINLADYRRIGGEDLTQLVQTTVIDPSKVTTPSRERRWRRPR